MFSVYDVFGTARTMTQILLNLTGIASELFLLGVFFYCRKQIKEFNLKSYTLSYFGSTSGVGRLFNISLLLWTILRFLFITAIISYFSFWNSYRIIVPAVGAFASAILAAIIPLSKNKLVHTISGFLTLFFSIIFIYMISLEFLRKSLCIGVVNIVILLGIVLSASIASVWV